MFFFWLWMAKKRGWKLGGIARVFAYAITMTVVLGLFAARQAQADTAEAARGLGRDLVALSDVLAEGQTLSINGERMHVASNMIAASPKTLLDRFQKNCEENPSVLGREFDGASKGMVKLGTMRSGDDDEGVVLCVVASEGAAHDIPTALDRFARTQDLGEIGKMRYFYAKKIGDRTQVLTAWTDDRFSFRALAPEGDGDAPGADSLVVPRPEGARRLLSAEVSGTSYAVRVYAVPGAPAAVIGSYDATMKARGFQRVHDAKKPNERAYVSGGLVITMVADAANDASGTTLSFAELGSNDAR
jgi:hypothetical protein